MSLVENLFSIFFSVVLLSLFRETKEFTGYEKFRFLVLYSPSHHSDDERTNELVPPNLSDGSCTIEQYSVLLINLTPGYQSLPVILYEVSTVSDR